MTHRHHRPCSDCGRTLGRGTRGNRCKACHLTWLTSDPEVAARRRAGIVRAWSDPNSAFHRVGPLHLLSPAERADYDLLKSKLYTRQEALRMIGRADLLPMAAE